MTPGKQFEKDFKDSVPENVMYYRFKDGTASFDKSEKTRFQPSNICDCMLFNQGMLYFLELKSLKGTSIPFGNFRDNQINELSKMDKFSYIVPGFIINFRRSSRTYFMQINQFVKYCNETDRKSIPELYFEEECIEIESRKLRVNYRYDIEGFLL